MSSVQKGDMSEEKGNRRESADKLLKINGLSYKMPQYLNMVTRRSLIRHYFDKSVYTNTDNNAKCILQSGDAYVDPKNSYLTFKVRCIGGKTGTFESGSAINMINRVTLTSESGVEVERVEEVNNLQRDIDRWTKSDAWIDSQGSVVGYQTDKPDVAALAIPNTNSSITAGDVTIGGSDLVGSSANVNVPHVETALTATDDRQWVIPLSHLCGLGASDQLLPGLGLMSGLRVQLGLENKAIALKWSADPSSASDYYELRDISIVLDSYFLDDSALRALNQQSKSNGLEVSINSFDTTPHDMTTSATTLKADAKTAVSRANYAFAKVRTTTDLAYGADSFASEAFDMSQYQWNLAGLYFPQQPIDTEYEMFQNALFSFNKANGFGEHSSVDVAKFNTNLSIAACTLERSGLLSLSGLPVSGSRILRLALNFNSANAGGRSVSIYMNYVKVLRIFLDRLVIKE